MSSTMIHAPKDFTHQFISRARLVQRPKIHALPYRLCSFHDLSYSHPRQESSTSQLKLLRDPMPICKVGHLNRRFLVTNSSNTAPCSDPMEVFKGDCINRQLCDEKGFRLKDAHWTMSLSISSTDSMTPPSLRTVGVQRVSPHGIEFVLKRKNGQPHFLNEKCGASVLLCFGRYKSGEKAYQWRGEGFCEEVPLSNLLPYIPNQTLVGMLASDRYENALDACRKTSKGSDTPSSDTRSRVSDRSHFTEVLQRARREVDGVHIASDEMEGIICAFRFRPNRIEQMVGSTDDVLMWQRWEWVRGGEGCHGTEWLDPRLLSPY